MTLHITNKIYEIADLLDMQVKQSRDFLDGVVTVPVVIGDFVLPVKLEVVSSLLTDTEAAVLCKVIGNLAIFVLPLEEKYSCALYVLDMARMKAKPENYIEDKELKTGAEVVASLSAAIVKWFIKRPSGWVLQ